MPKVLRIINRLNLGGPTYNTAYLTKYLSPEYETLLVAGMKDESEESSEYILKTLGLKATYILSMKRHINPLADYSAYKKIKKIIKEFKPDIVHTHASKAGALGRLAAYHCKVPVIVHTFHGHVFHSYFGKIKTKIFTLLEKYLASKSTKIIAISDQQKKDLLYYKICKPEKIEVIPLGFDLKKFKEKQEEKSIQFREKYKVKKTDVAIGIIGRLVPIKNHRLFIDIINMVKKRSTKNIKAFIIGDGELKEEIQQYIKKTGLKYSEKDALDSDVIFTSWIKSIDIAYAGLDIIMLTSLNEGTPVSLIEAQAAGKPIVSTNVGGIEDIVIKDETALLSNLDNIEQLAKYVIDLSENENKRITMGKKAGLFMNNKFGYQSLINKVSNLYHFLLFSEY